jgi:hypothetical protein
VWAGVERHFDRGISPKDNDMSQTKTPSAPSHDIDDPNEPVPFMQKLLDNPFILLFLGVMVPMVVYTLWGVIDILTVPLAK